MAPYLSLLGGGWQFGAALSQGNADASFAKANANIAALQSQSEFEKGSQQAELYRQHLNATVGRQRAQIGGSGLSASGSALRSLETTSQLGAQDISRIQTNAARSAWGFQTQEVGDLARAKYDQQGGVMQGLGSLITSGARAYGQWNQS